MDLTVLSAISPLDGRYADKLNKLRPLVSEYGLIHLRVLVQIRWLITLANSPDIPEISPLNNDQHTFLKNIIENFTEANALKIKSIEKTTNHDVKAVEYFIREKILTRADLKALVPFIHFACTSEDINNLAYAIMLDKINKEHMLPLLKEILENLKKKATNYSNIAMLARTHGQSATPTTLGKEFANVFSRLQRQLQSLSTFIPLGKFNGAVGNYNAHRAAYPDVDWPSINAAFVESFGLAFNPLTTQIEPHDNCAEFLQTLARINTILIDLSRDIWGYVSLGYFSQEKKHDEIGSSTMPHKVNPIDFENAEGNLGVANALSNHLAMKLPISRWQRDLSDSTVMRNLGSTTAYSLLAFQSLLKGLNKINANEDRIEKDLENRWEVIAEAVQTVMRRYGVDDAYEQLKKLTHGKAITKTTLREFIKTAKLPEEAKKALSDLTPKTYTGFASTLAILE